MLLHTQEMPPVGSGRKPVHTHVWRVTGLDCPNCAREIETAIRNAEGISGAEIDFIGGTLKVLCSLEENCKETLLALAKDHGVEFLDVHEEPGVRHGGLLPWEAGIMAVSGLFLSLAWGFGLPWLYLAAMLVAGGPVGRKALSDLSRGEITMNLLMFSAAIGAAAIKEWHEGAMVLFLYAVAKWLERVSSDRARSSIEALKLQLPAVAHVLTGKNTADRPLDQLQIRDRILIKPGEKIPADGVVLQGQSAVDESTLTGESQPLLKDPGSAVFAGTWNQNGTLTVEVSVPVSESKFSRIMVSVERAQSRKTRFQGAVERFAAIYTPIVVFLALAVAFVPPLLGLGAFRDWLYSALVMLVIACPCALVIAAPVTLVSALTAAARVGVLIRGGDVLEAASQVKAIALDKTGTLTQGRPRILEILPFLGSEQEVLVLAAALENASEHPLASAFRDAIQERNLPLPEVTGFAMTRGMGVEGVIRGKRYRFGRPDWAAGLVAGCAPAIPEVPAKCVTHALLVGEDGIAGQILLGDTVRPEAEHLADLARGLGIARIVLLSGDRPEVAREFGALLKLDEAQGGMLPEDKARRIEELNREIGPTLMVGDGVNDTPALVAASVGVAMGHRGSDAVLETAGAVLLHDNLEKVLNFLLLSRKAHALIWQNIALAVVLKVAVFVLALAGMATLWMAVMADTGAAVLVVLNGLRALRPVPLPEEPCTCRDCHST